MNKKCCENCCELCQDGKAPYCMPNGDFKEVLSMEHVCDDYKDCRIESKTVRSRDNYV
jgi:hypothetical protein